MLLFMLSIVLVAYTKALVALIVDVVLILFLFEHKILNIRRIGFLLSLVNFLIALKLNGLATFLIAIASSLFSPSPIVMFVTTLPLWLLDLKYLIVLVPLAISLALGDRRCVSSFGIYWMRSWMGDDYYPLEKLVHKLGEKKKALFVRVGNVVFTNVHFGLMRFAMSSLMPHLMALRGYVPHRLCGSHERNASSRWEGYKLLKNVRFWSHEERVIPIDIFENDKVRLVKINDVNIVEHKDGADDLPCIDKIIIADPHNCEGMSPNEDELLRALNSLTKVDERNCKDMTICEVEVDGKGLCWNKAFLVEYKCERPFRHLVLFANNMEKCERENLDFDLVSTVDDHTRSGFGRNTYIPASQVEVRSIIKCSDVRTTVEKVEWEYVAMGSKMFSKKSMEVMEKYIKLGIVAVITSLFLSLVV